jgi:hypothetical protein
MFRRMYPEIDSEDHFLPDCYEIPTKLGNGAWWELSNENPNEREREVIQNGMRERLEIERERARGL